VAHYGFTPEEAFTAPPNKPLWMIRLESEEGCNFAEVVNRWRKCGGTLADLARSVGVHKDTVSYHVRKMMI